MTCEGGSGSSASVARLLGLLAIVAISVAAAVLLGAPAQAIDSPHDGSFSVTADICSACHRTHTAQGAGLIALSSQYDLCVTCHDGTGADTNVVEGIYMGTADGATGAGLRGGGFEKTLMNTSLSDTFNETGVPVGVTSRHGAGTGPMPAWGYGSIGFGETVTLECGSCHDPHGSESYRDLRVKPKALPDWWTLDPVVVADESAKTFTITYDADHRRDMGAYDGATLSTLAAWCSQCHTRYLADGGSGSTSSGDAVFTFRHMTSGFSGGCLTCHVAHGSSAIMGPASSTVPMPDGTSGGGSADSRLLAVDNRGVCTGCHLDDTGAVVGPGGFTCSGCHAGASDVDNYVYGDSTRAMVSSGEWSSAGHGLATGTYSATGNPAADFPGAAGGGNDCLYCHSDSVAHGDVTSPFRLTNTVGPDGQNGVCYTCHKTGSTGYDPDGAGGMASKNGAVKVASNHYGSKHAGGNNGGSFCWDCHDPHGDSNAAMVQGAVSSQTDGIYGSPTAVAATTLSTVGTWGSYVNDVAFDGICQVCHTTTGRFTGATGYDAAHYAGTACTSCHTHDTGFAPSTVTSGSHTPHLSVTFRGPETPLVCGSCHDTGSLPTFGDGQNLAGTTVCNTCHSPAGAYDGVGDAVIGAKNNWASGVYSGALLPGKEQWCAGCHDDQPAVIDGLTAPDVANFWSMPKGQSGTVDCESCHNTTSGSHIDSSGSDPNLTGAFVKATYWDTDAQTELALCFSCHDYSVYYEGQPGSSFGKHEKHVRNENSSCYACHESHGESGVVHQIRIVPVAGPVTGFTHDAADKSDCQATCHGGDGWKDYDHK